MKNSKTWVAMLLIIIYSSCTTIKELHTNSLKKDSSANEVSSKTEVKKIDSVFKNTSAASAISTDKGRTKVVEHNANTETSISDWQIVHAKTNASDFFPQDVIRLNNNTLLAKKSTTTKKGDKTKNTDIQNDIKNSSANNTSSAVDLKKSDSSNIDSNKNVAVKSVTATKDLHKRKEYWSWWYLLIFLPIILVLRYRKIILSFLGWPINKIPS